MPLDIKSEIARRLEVDEDELEPVLESVVQRIRQQVMHYGYARLAGLGTFRGRDGQIVFEPDAVLAETVNLRFAGLESIRVTAPAEEDAPAEVAATGASRWDERELPESHTLSEFEEEEESVAQSTEPEPGEAAPPTEAGFEEEEEERWRDQEEEDGHPLGPVPAPAYEDAEFSFVEHQEGEEGPLPELDFDDESEEEPAASEKEEAGVESASMWAALGAANVEEPDGPSEEDEYAAAEAETEQSQDTEPPPADEVEPVAAEAQHEEPADAESETAEAVPAGRKRGPDRDALHHEHAQRDWPSEHDPSGLDRQASRRNTILIGAGIVVLVAAAAVAYFSLQPVEPTGGDAPTAQRETQQPAGADAAGGEAADDAQTPQAEAPTETTPAETTPSEPESAPAESAAESTPLRSPEGIDAGAGGFTIVVFSETSESSATEVAQQYRGDGFRSDVLSSQEGGVTRYRVGIGQFETLEAAVDARNQLAGNDLPQDAWVHRLE